MYLRITYEPEFEDLWMYLKSKYPAKLFDLDGVGKQLDLARFSKDFFSTKDTTADKSVDSNSNVDDISVVTYVSELPKPFFRLNSYYILWKYARKLFDHKTANEMVERCLSGDIYPNDFHGVGAGLPYSYHPNTVLTIKINDEILYCTMYDLFDMFKKQVVQNFDYEEIDFTNLKYPIKIDYPKTTGNTNHLKTDFIFKKIDIKVLDNNQKWTNIQRIIRHKTNKKLIKIGTKCGKTTIVTSDHPVILEDGTVVLAENLKMGSRLKISNSQIELNEKIYVNNDFAYLIGFWLGDGFSNKSHSKKTKGALWIAQKNIENHKIINIIKKYFNNVRIYSNKVYFGASQFYNYFCNELKMGLGASTKKLPINILQWNKEAIISLICGIIDSDGTINKENGHISIRIASFAMVQQIREILNALGIKNVRCSHIIYKTHNSEKKIKTKMEMYRVSFRIDKYFEEFKMSDKILNNYEVCTALKGIDGRFETNEVCFIDEYKNNCEYVYDITTDSGQFHSQGLIQHNCFNYDTYDIMNFGLPYIKKIKSIPPKHFWSFKSQLEQFVTYASNNTLGACGIANIWVVASYYIKRLFNEDNIFKNEESIWKYIKEEIQSFIYTVNQPFRSNQSPFTNASIYDKYFLEEMCQDYRFPDGSYPDIDLIMKIQELYLQIMNEELERTPVTFPVTTACFSIDEYNNIKDKEFKKLIAKYNKKFGFLNIYNGDTSTLSSCCRLRSNIVSEYFNSFGAGSSKIGSLGVKTINIPRIACFVKDEEEYFKELEYLTELAQKMNHVKRHIIKIRIENGNLPLYKYGFMDIKKQYSTVGVVGLNEACYFMGYDILTEKGQNFIKETINTINRVNDKCEKKYKFPHNTEQVPAENSAIKLAQKDKLLKFQNEFDIYSNQFIPLTTNADMLDRIKLQGMFDKDFSGGAICHINVEERIEDEKVIEDLIEECAKKGIVYWAINYNLQMCKDGHMTVGKKNYCNICGKNIIDNFTRVVGFLTNTKNWHKVRREQDYPYRQFYKGVSNENSGNTI